MRRGVGRLVDVETANAADHSRVRWLADLRTYLENMVTVRAQMRREAQQLLKTPFDGPEHLILKRGTVYQNGGVYGEPVARQCFYRSYLAATRKRSKWIYCEGFATNKFIPVWHAWLTRADTPGVAFEGAWENAEGAVYIGLPFRAEYVRSCCDRSGNMGGILYDMLREGDDIEAAIWKP